MEPMLASPGGSTLDDLERLMDRGDCIADIKWDGIRAIAEVRDGQVNLWNRRGTDIAFRYPELVLALSNRFPFEPVVLDGEIVCFDNGRPSFPLTHRRDAQSKPTQIAVHARWHPATYVAFDLLLDHSDTSLCLNRPLAERLLKLHSLDMEGLLTHSQYFFTAEPAWDFVTSQQMEGLIVKRITSFYQPGKRSHDWWKIKPIKTVSCVVTGCEDGEGRRAKHFGALHIALVRPDGKLHPVGKVGTGWSDQELDELTPLARSGKMFVIEVAYQEVGVGGQLRFPSYKGIRTDVAPESCSINQLGPEEVPQ